MNTALWEKHLENLELKRQLKEVTRRIVYRCIYCGNPTESTIAVCAGHKDLPQLDPGYQGARRP